MALFPHGKGGSAEVAYGYKGKGVLIHLLVDTEAMPVPTLATAANAYKRKPVSQTKDMILKN